MRSFPCKTFMLTVGIVLTGGQILAGNKAPESIIWFLLMIGLLGGLALFLFGIDKMSTALKKSGGAGMRRILAQITGNRFIALLTGAFVTMMIQSSSATTMMLVSFVQSGLMNFSQSFGIILGANIGTTFTAQLIAFNLTDYAVMMIALGFGLSLLLKKDTLKNIGDSIFGFGRLFYGMKLIKKEFSMDFSNESKLELKEYHAKILNQMNLLSEVFEKRNTFKAVKIPVNGELYKVLKSKFMTRHYARLHRKVNQSVVTHKLHSELFNALNLIGILLENCFAGSGGENPLGNGKKKNLLKL